MYLIYLTDSDEDAAAGQEQQAPAQQQQQQQQQQQPPPAQQQQQPQQAPAQQQQPQQAGATPGEATGPQVQQQQQSGATQPQGQQQPQQAPAQQQQPQQAGPTPGDATQQQQQQTPKKKSRWDVPPKKLPPPTYPHPEERVAAQKERERQEQQEREERERQERDLERRRTAALLTARQDPGEDTSRGPRSSQGSPRQSVWSQPSIDLSEFSIDSTEVDDPSVVEIDLQPQSSDSDDNDDDAPAAAGTAAGKKRRKNKGTGKKSAAAKRKKTIDDEEDLTELERETDRQIKAALRRNDLGRMLVALMDSKERRLFNHILEMKEDIAGIKAKLAAKDRDEMEVKLNNRQLVSSFRANNSVQSVRRQLGLPWTTVANVCAVVESSEQTEMLERHIRDTITNHGGHWHLNLNIELFEKEFLSKVFVYESKLVPPDEEYSPRPIHFCMEEYWLLPPGITTIVRGMIEDRKKRQQDENDPVYSDQLETKFRSVSTIYAAWAKDVQNKRNQAKWPKIHRIQARVQSPSIDMNDWGLMDFFYNMIIMVSGNKQKNNFRLLPTTLAAKFCPVTTKEEK